MWRSYANQVGPDSCLCSRTYHAISVAESDSIPHVTGLVSSIAVCDKVPGHLFFPLTYVDCSKFPNRTPPCDLSLEAPAAPFEFGSRCSSNPACKAFLTNGWLKSVSLRQ